VVTCNFFLLKNRHITKSS